ncbi:c-type cytochrome [uncultured Algibacter sp.]|uniref:c-type cytochrome n=1 Tax=uncultured Algibacter sp. TaxID=298659 RepID=UPI00261B35BE|nr:c-type cytochrome [uncultured Algibacter sp.]
MKPLILLTALVFVVSCQKTKKYPPFVQHNNQEIHPGKKLMENQCNICHSATASHDERLAPPMIAVKKRYILEGTNKEDFINDIYAWFENPTEANAKMYGAVKRFGLMPKLEVSEEKLKQISDYIYDNDIEKPDWFDKHYNEQRKKGFLLRKEIIN